MKKCLLVLMLVMLLVFDVFAAEDEGKRLNLLAGIGTASSDLMGGGVLGLGIEKEYSKNIYVQLFLSYYRKQNILGDSPGHAYSVNLYSVLKKPVGILNFVLKAGPHLAIIKDNREWLFPGDESKTKFGVGGGLGLEFNINKRFAIYSGLTAKMNFGSDNFNWLEAHIGINFRLR